MEIKKSEALFQEAVQYSGWREFSGSSLWFYRFYSAFYQKSGQSADVG